MSAAQVPEWVRVFEAVIIGLGLSTFLCVVFAASHYLICLTVKGIKALFRRKGKTESFSELDIIKDLQEDIDDLEERVEELELHESEKRQEAVEEFKQTQQEAEKFVDEKFRLINEKITGSTKILEASIPRLQEIIKELKK